MSEKLKIFIGSSGESRDKAEEIAVMLEYIGVEVNLWCNPGTFTSGESTLKSVTEAIEKADGSIFVIAEDDLLYINKDTAKKPEFTARDNVLIEWGLSCGLLGSEATALCVFGNPRIPSDLKGINYIIFDETKQSTVKKEIRKWIEEKVRNSRAGKSSGDKSKCYDETKFSTDSASSTVSNNIYKEKLSHYYKRMEVTLEVNCCGNAVLHISSFIHINNKGELQHIRQSLNLPDAAEDFSKIPISDMLLKDKKIRFEEFGFWIASDNNIISSVNEFYWNENNPKSKNEDVIAESNKKILKWRYMINGDRIENGNVYHIEAAISLPSMFPMMSGCFLKNRSYIKKYYKQNFTWGLEAYADEFKLTVKFDEMTAKHIRNLESKKNNSGEKHYRDPVKPDEYESNLFGKTFTAEIKNGRIGDTIDIEWDIDQLQVGD
jgi:hypothetical protein